jgi:hypothetical protein
MLRGPGRDLTSARSANGADVEAHVIQLQTHTRGDRGGEPRASLLRQALEVRREDRRGHKCG